MAEAKKAKGTHLSEGMDAPKFFLAATTGVKVRLEDFKNANIVILYFYPKDNTPGCKQEGLEFQNYKTQFNRNGTIVLGISPDSMESHRAFCKKNKLTFPLLVDTGSKVATKYGVWREKTLLGQTFTSVRRTTFVIGKDGKIKKIFERMKIAGHAKAVLEFVKKLKKLEESGGTVPAGRKTTKTAAKSTKAAAKPTKAAAKPTKAAAKPTKAAAKPTKAAAKPTKAAAKPTKAAAKPTKAAAKPAKTSKTKATQKATPAKSVKAKSTVKATPKKTTKLKKTTKSSEKTK